MWEVKQKLVLSSKLQPPRKCWARSSRKLLQMISIWNICGLFEICQHWSTTKSQTSCTSWKQSWVLQEQRSHCAAKWISWAAIFQFWTHCHVKSGSTCAILLRHQQPPASSVTSFWRQTMYLVMCPFTPLMALSLQQSIRGNADLAVEWELLVNLLSFTPTTIASTTRWTCLENSVFLVSHTYIEGKICSMIKRVNQKIWAIKLATNGCFLGNNRTYIQQRRTWIYQSADFCN